MERIPTKIKFLDPEIGEEAIFVLIDYDEKTARYESTKTGRVIVLYRYGLEQFEVKE